MEKCLLMKVEIQFMPQLFLVETMIEMDFHVISEKLDSDVIGEVL